MPLIKKSTQTLVPYTVQIPLELQKNIERVIEAADRRDMTFDLESTVVRVIKTEVTRAQTALGLGAGGVRTRKSQAQTPTPDASPLPE